MAQTKKGSGKANKKQQNQKKAIIKLFAISVITIIFAIIAFVPQINRAYNKVLDKAVGITTYDIAYDCEVRFIDVGQGDSALIISDGANILVDGGENGKGEVVVDYLKALDIKELDMIIATHPHSDHIGGLDTVMESFPVKRVIIPKIADDVVPTTKTATDFLLAIKNQGIKPEYANPKNVYTFGKGKITVFAPVKEFDDLNNSSIGFRFDYNEQASFLFTGDMEKEAENAVLKEPDVNLKADVLKSGHHGSKTSSSKKFFEKINPQFCVISVGTDNSYNLPNKEILDRYSRGRATLYRTDLSGDIVIGYDESGYHVLTEHE